MPPKRILQEPHRDFKQSPSVFPDGLERTGWVCKDRCAADARVTYAVLTEAGRAKFEEAEASHLADLEELFASRFTHEEQMVLSELLGRLPLAPAPAACGGDEKP